MATARYLRGRGYTGPIPETIRHADALLYEVNGVRLGGHPALVAAVQQVDGTATGVWRIYLTGSGDKAAIEHAGKPRPIKLGLGSVRGGAVRLSDPGPMAVVTEGIETGLAVLEARGDLLVLAALSASGIRGLVLPDGVAEVILCADADKAGEGAATAAAGRFYAAGIRVRIARPPAKRKGYDFADLLADEGVEAVRAALAAAEEWQPVDAGAIAAAQREKLLTCPPTFGDEPLPYDAANRRLRDASEVWFGQSSVFVQARHERDEAVAEVTATTPAEAGGAESLDEIEGEELRRRRHAASIAVRDRHGIAAWTRPPRLSLQAAAGIGKTRTVAEVLGTLPELWTLNIDLFVPRIDLAEEIRAAILAAYRERFGPAYFLGPDVRVMRGRSQPHPDTGEPLCQRADLAERVAKVGQPVFSTLCHKRDDMHALFSPDKRHPECPHYRSCPYIRQYRDREPAIRIYTHDHLHLPRPWQLDVPRGDLVIVDESCLETLVGHASFGLDRLTAFRRLARDEDQADLLVLSHKVHDALLAGGGLLAELRARGITPEDMRHAAALEESDEEEPLGVRPNMNDRVIVRRLDAYEASERHKRARMFRCLARELELARDGCHAVELRRDEPRHGERQDRVVVHHLRRLEVGAHVPVLLLDADADAEINRRIWGAHTEHIAIPVERKATVVQVYSTRFSNSSLLAGHPGATFKDRRAAERRRGEIAALVRRKVAERGRGLVVASRRVRCALTGEGPEGKLDIAVEWQGAAITHFGALRGRDAYKEYAWALIVGREQPPPQAVEGIARAVWAEDPEPLHLPGGYDEAPRGYRMRDGSERGVTAQVHPDPRVQRVLELKRERETVQAIDRLRLVHRDEPAEVTVLCSLPLDLTVDRLASWLELRGGGTRLQRVLLRRGEWGGAVPLAPGWLAEKFPELWPPPKAAEHDLAREVQNPQTANKFTTCMLGVLALYRATGARRRSRASWWGDLGQKTSGALAQALGEAVVIEACSFAYVPDVRPEWEAAPHAEFDPDWDAAIAERAARHLAARRSPRGGGLHFLEGLPLRSDIVLPPSPPPQVLPFRRVPLPVRSEIVVEPWIYFPELAVWRDGRIVGLDFGLPLPPEYWPTDAEFVSAPE